jgi:hypothetical protein
MKNYYAQEKLYLAVDKLISENRDLKTRLWNAFLVIHPLRESDFPEEFKCKWNLIYSRLTKEIPTYDNKGATLRGSAQNTLDILSLEECEEIAMLIHQLYDDLMNVD